MCRQYFLYRTENLEYEKKTSRSPSWYVQQASHEGLKHLP